MAPLLAYWNTRGYIQSIRMILAQAGVEWEEKLYQVGDAPDFRRDPEWIKDKEDGLGLDFPNLPYYIDGDVKLTQSMAISRYLARKHGLIAESEEAQIRQDLAEHQLVDFRLALGKLAYQEYSEENRATYVKQTLPQHLKLFSKFLGDREWLTGQKLNFVDLLFYDVVDWHLYLDPNCLKDFSNLAALMKRVEESPRIKAWMGSDKYQSWPLFVNIAKWGYDEADQYLRYPALKDQPV